MFYIIYIIISRYVKKKMYCNLQIRILVLINDNFKIVLIASLFSTSFFWWKNCSLFFLFVTFLILNFFLKYANMHSKKIKKIIWCWVRIFCWEKNSGNLWNCIFFINTSVWLECERNLVTWDDILAIQSQRQSVSFYSLKNYYK